MSPPDIDREVKRILAELAIQKHEARLRVIRRFLSLLVVLGMPALIFLALEPSWAAANAMFWMVVPLAVMAAWT